MIDYETLVLSQKLWLVWLVLSQKLLARHCYEVGLLEVLHWIERYEQEHGTTS